MAAACLALGSAAAAAPDSDRDAAPLIRLETSAAPVADVPWDPLYALIRSGRSLTAEEADALLQQAYDAYPAPAARSRAFALAAAAASNAGRHDLALAWTDWALKEAERAPERERLLAQRLEEAVGVALKASNPVLARSYARHAAGATAGWSDRPGARAMRFEALALECPDVIEDAYIRLRAADEPAGPGGFGPGSIGVESARCDYVPIADPGGASPGADGFAVYAVRSHMGLDAKARGVTEAGLDGREAAARRALAQRLPTLTTQLEPLVFADGEGRLGYARYSRRGVDEVAAFAYAAAKGEGVFYAAEASGAVWDWPPEALGVRAQLGLAAVLGR